MVSSRFISLLLISSMSLNTMGLLYTVKSSQSSTSRGVISILIRVKLPRRSCNLLGRGLSFRSMYSSVGALRSLSTSISVIQRNYNYYYFVSLSCNEIRKNSFLVTLDQSQWSQEEFNGILCVCKLQHK